MRHTIMLNLKEKHAAMLDEMSGFYCDTPEDMLRLAIEWAYVVFRKDELDALQECFDFKDAARKKPEDDDLIPF
ncbi:hypothetical protein [Cribrihabitans neustonicus]|uniref:hypothetical protein n=1 Tax=Cribrihabitans neustonicus TaxID=1429085 RepID=UPI003B5A9DA9